MHEGWVLEYAQDGACRIDGREVISGWNGVRYAGIGSVGRHATFFVEWVASSKVYLLLLEERAGRRLLRVDLIQATLLAGRERSTD